MRGDLIVRDEPAAWPAPSRQHQFPNSGRIYHGHDFGRRELPVEKLRSADFSSSRTTSGRSWRVRPRTGCAHASMTFVVLTPPIVGRSERNGSLVPDIR